MRVILLSAFALLLAGSPAHAESYADGLRALHRLTLEKGIEVSRNYFHLARAQKPPGAWWGRVVEGDESSVGLDEQEPRDAIARAKEAPAAHIRWCNFHVHRKSAMLRLQKERNEPAPYGNLSFPPSGADVQISLVGEETWGQEGITGESSMGVFDSLGLWMYRELGNEQDPRRQALYRRHGFTPAELEATRSAGGDAAELLRYKYMKQVNARPRRPEEITALPEYRLLVLRYAVLEDVEVSFLTLAQALRTEPCRGF